MSHHHVRSGLQRIALCSLTLLCGCAGGIRNLYFTPTEASTAIFRKLADGTFPHDAWSAQSLGPMPGIDLRQQSIDVSYETIPAPVSVPNEIFRTEALVMAQDPREPYDFLSGLLNDPAAWDARLGICQSPDVVALQYPQASLLGLGTAPASIRLSPAYFWSRCEVPDKPLTVQAAVIHDRGYCDMPVKIQDILDQIQDQLWAEFYPKVVENGCADAERPWSFLTSYIFENPTLDPDVFPSGGFIINSYLKADIHVPFVQDANIRFNYQYQFALGGGILSVNASRNGLDVSGHFSDDDKNKLVEGLESRLPNSLNQKAREKQVLDLPFNADCEPASADDATVPVGGPMCALPIRVLTDGIDKIAGNGTLARFGLVPDQAAAELKATILDSQNGKYTNWQCAKHNGDNNRCGFILRAKRVNVFPDEADLVWFDSYKETGYTGLAAFMYLQSSTDLTGQTDQLCKPRINPPSRSFATSVRKSDKAPASGQSCVLSLLDDALHELASHSWIQWIGGAGF